MHTWATFHEDQSGHGFWRQIGSNRTYAHNYESVGFIPKPYGLWPGEKPTVYFITVKPHTVSDSLVNGQVVAAEQATIILS